MSGPKSGDYAVETAQAVEARAYAAALADYERARAAMSRLRARALAAKAGLGKQIPVPHELPAGRSVAAGSADLARAAVEAADSVASAEDGLLAALAAVNQARWQERVSTVVVDDRMLESAAEQHARRTGAAAAPVDAWRSRYLQEVDAIAQAWPSTPEDVPLAALDQAAVAVRSASSASAASLAVARVRDLLRAERAATEARRTRLETLDALAAQTESVRDWADPAALAAVTAALASPDADLDVLGSRTRELVATAHARRDRVEAADILADVLVELGYEVGESFTTRLDDDDVLVGRPEWRDHAVSVRLDLAGHVSAHVVRADDVPATADDAVDEQFCTQFDAMVALAAGRGLEVGAVRRFEPGSRSVRSVDATRVRAAAGTGTTTRPLRTRSL